jgi:hypothetical protein
MTIRALFTPIWPYPGPSRAKRRRAPCRLDAPHGRRWRYPIPDHDGSVEPGHRLTNWLWYRNVPEGPELDHLLTGKDGVCLASSLPPDLVRPEQRRRLREDALGASRLPDAVPRDMRRLADAQPQDDENMRATLFLEPAGVSGERSP